VEPAKAIESVDDRVRSDVVDVAAVAVSRVTVVPEHFAHNEDEVWLGLSGQGCSR
jgi:hypothetical protein